jgi:hypothetical protein
MPRTEKELEKRLRALLLKLIQQGCASDPSQKQLVLLIEDLHLLDACSLAVLKDVASKVPLAVPRTHTHMLARACTR